MEKIQTTSKQKNILYVDSDREMTRNLKDYLEHHEIKDKYGLNFVFAGTAKEALKKIVEQKIDLIVLEILLPVINGYYLLDAIKKEPTQIPVVIYTKLKGPQDLAKMAASEVDNIFVKQLMKIEDLVQIIANYDGNKAELDKVLLELQSQIKSVSDTDTHSQLKVIQCPRCSLVLTRDSRFCNNCGQKIFKTTKRIQAKTAPDEQVPTEQTAETPETPEAQVAETQAPEAQTAETPETPEAQVAETQTPEKVAPEKVVAETEKKV